MRDFIILTDSSADLTEEMSKDLGIRTIQLGVVVEGAAPVPNNEVDVKDIYNKLRNKTTITTSAANIEQFLRDFGKILEENPFLYQINLFSCLA